MKEKEENLSSLKLQAVIEFLNLEDLDEISKIDEIGNTFTYNGDEYLVLDSREVDDYLENLVNSKLEEMDDTLESVLDDYDYLKYYVIINEHAVRESVDMDSIGEGDWNEVGGYYIFLM